MAIERTILGSIDDNSIRFLKNECTEKQAGLKDLIDTPLLTDRNYEFSDDNSGQDDSSEASDLASLYAENDEDEIDAVPSSLDEKSLNEVESDTPPSGNENDAEKANAPAAYLDDSFTREAAELPTERGRPSACVFVASLSSNLSDDILCQSVTSHFKQWGSISLVKVLRDPANRPYAFVQFKKDEEAKRAIIEGQHSLLNGRTVRCEKARVNRTLYIETTNKGMSDDDIKTLLEKFGEIEKFVGAEEKDCEEGSVDEEYSFWFCKFVFRQDAISAYANLKVKPFWNVEWAQNLEDESSDTPEVTIDKYSIFVGQLDPRISREDLLERFEHHGKIKEAILVNRPLNNFAFIKFETRKAAASAVERENHSMFKFRTIHVQYREMYNNYKKKLSSENGGVKLSLAPPPVSFRRRHSYAAQDSPKRAQSFYSTRLAGIGSPPLQQSYQHTHQPTIIQDHSRKQSMQNGNLNKYPFRRPLVNNNTQQKKYTYNQPPYQKTFRSSFDFGSINETDSYQPIQYRAGSRGSDSYREYIDSDDENTVDTRSHDPTAARNTYTGHSLNTNGAPKTNYSSTSVDGEEYSPSMGQKSEFESATLEVSPISPSTAVISSGPGYYPPQIPYYYMIPPKDMGYPGSPVSPEMVENGQSMNMRGNNQVRHGNPQSQAFYYTYSPYDPAMNPAIYPYYLYYNPNPIPGTANEMKSKFSSGDFDQTQNY
ncbi:hypothetical protein CANARDRAFT_5886 [[Candida] arabinofermentans NRRL YB-2248]|uniref:RRM domain-containing protein n=1 Tax=[Candida] arabinofermentans NRRL YB-2248 TaxID=983967 RepID=A0A1E4T6F4_9ASCO|nr:hypothetical protein CANARDRAFT_5886 [[Candida] arabinofermentans NRRL YB-2248]